MGKCPFWSSEEESHECFGECILNKDIHEGDECIFKEYLEDDDDLKKLE